MAPSLPGLRGQAGYLAGARPAQSRQHRLYARRVMETAYPADILFVERGVYEQELPVEYAWCCLEMGLHAEAVRVNERLLASPGTPPALREIAERNRRRSFTALDDGAGTARGQANGAEVCGKGG